MPGLYLILVLYAFVIGSAVSLYGNKAALIYGVAFLLLFCCFPGGIDIIH